MKHIKEFHLFEDQNREFYHGSPHKFDKFDMDKVGSGDGLNKFGFGLYFADHRDTAEYYARELSIEDLKKTGFNIYTVNLLDLDNFYEWDHEIPEDLFLKIADKLEEQGYEDDAETMRQELDDYQTTWSMGSTYEITRDTIGGDKEATTFLNELGISGIIAQSPAHEGNVYVAFSDDIVKITNIDQEKS